MPPFPLLDLNELHHQDDDHSPRLRSPSSSSSLFNPPRYHEDSMYTQSQLQHDHTILERENNETRFDIVKPKNEVNEDHNQWQKSLIKLTASKMRIVRKIVNPKSQQDPSGLDTDNRTNINTFFNNNITIRVCTDCNTTKTPLWRSGPRGPKSLCNACGIRQRKARQAAAAANGTSVATDHKPCVKKKVQQQKDKRGINSQLPFKKRYKLVSATNAASCSSKKLCFEDFTLRLSEKNSSLQRAVPQELKEAAILLMALSCGLVHG